MLVCLSASSCFSIGYWVVVPPAPASTPGTIGRIWVCGVAVFEDGSPAANVSVVAFSEEEIGSFPKEPSQSSVVVRDTGGVRSPTNVRGEFCLRIPDDEESSGRHLLQVRGTSIRPVTTVIEGSPAALVVVVRALP